MKFRTKLLLILMIITIAPMTFLMSFAYLQYNRIIHMHVSSLARNQFESLSLQVQNSYRTITHSLGMLTFYSSSNLSILSAMRSMNEEEEISGSDMYRLSQNIMPTCQSIMYMYQDINGIYVFSTSGHVIGHARNYSTNIQHEYNPLQDDWFQETVELDGSIYISSVDHHPMFKSYSESFFAAQLIRDVDRGFEPLGVVVIDCSPELFDLGSVNALADISEITLTTADPQSVIYSNHQDLPASIQDTEENTHTEAVQLTPFVLTLTLDYDYLLSEFDRTFVMLAWLILFCLVCITLVILYINRSFLTPVQRLSEQMRSQNAPLPYAPYYGNQNSEIGVLYRKYNEMIENVNASIKRDYQNKLIVMDAQMQSLEASINSHFLFNTLESINSMAELADQDDICTMALSLSRMFRYAIKTDSELVTLREELEHVRNYHSIQTIRYGGRYQLVIDVPEDLMEQKLLKLLLQPLAENALIHGLDHCRFGSLIRISAALDDTCLTIQVYDNGKGMAPETLERLNEDLRRPPSFTELGHRSRQHIGIKNIQSRIELYYGQGYGLTIESQEGSFTSIFIKIPVIPSTS